jgi:hypothetical protein
VDIDSFSDVVAEVAKEAETSAAAIEIADPQSVSRQDEASPEFTKELEMIVHKGEDPAPEVPFVETRENLPENQDPSPSMIAFNKSFGTPYWGELLSVGYENIDAKDGSSKILTLWNSSKIMGETGEGYQGKDLYRLSGLLKICRLLPKVRRLLLGLLLKCLPKKVHELYCFSYLYFISNFTISYLLLLLRICQISKNFFGNILLTKLKSTRGLIH